MIYDSLDNFMENLPRYMPRCAELAEFLRAAREKSFDELKNMDFPQLDLRFNEYETKPEAEIPFEAHRKLWDLQLVLEGKETPGNICRRNVGRPGADKYFCSEPSGTRVDGPGDPCRCRNDFG